MILLALVLWGWVSPDLPEHHVCHPSLVPAAWGPAPVLRCPVGVLPVPGACLRVMGTKQMRWCFRIREAVPEWQGCLCTHCVNTACHWQSSCGFTEQTCLRAGELIASLRFVVELGKWWLCFKKLQLGLTAYTLQGINAFLVIIKVRLFWSSIIKCIVLSQNIFQDFIVSIDLLSRNTKLGIIVKMLTLSLISFKLVITSCPIYSFCLF